MVSTLTRSGFSRLRVSFLICGDLVNGFKILHLLDAQKVLRVYRAPFHVPWSAHSLHFCYYSREFPQDSFLAAVSDLSFVMLLWKICVFQSLLKETYDMQRTAAMTCIFSYHLQYVLTLRRTSITSVVCSRHLSHRSFFNNCRLGRDNGCNIWRCYVLTSLDVADVYSQVTMNCLFLKVTTDLLSLDFHFLTSTSLADKLHYCVGKENCLALFRTKEVSQDCLYYQTPTSLRTAKGERKYQNRISISVVLGPLSIVYDFRMTKIS